MKTSLKDTQVGFFSVTPNRYFFSLFERAGVQNVLISYHYIRQHKEQVEKEILPWIREKGGLFMTDSGAFSFFADKSFDYKTFDWDEYIVEYTDWLMANKEYVFIACNLDVDAYVGHDQVMRWNKAYFKPLEEYMNIAYVAHSIKAKSGQDLTMVKEYMKEHDFVAVSEEFTSQASNIYQMAKQTKTTVHGLAWTKPTVLRDYPFFSVDSSSWVNYQKYGATPVWDGVNFSQYDGHNKDIRATLKKQCEKYEVNHKWFCTELNDEGKHNDSEGLTFSLRTWLDVLNNLKVKSKLKLKTTVEALLEGKATVFQPVKEGGLGSFLQGLSQEVDMKEIGEGSMQLYGTDEETGAEVAQYKPRTERLSINDFEKKMGSTMFCSNCFINDKCPQFKANSACAFDFAPNSGEILQPLQLIDKLIMIQMERVNRAMFMEKMEGGLPNKTYTGEIDKLQRLNSIKVDMIMKANGQGKISITKTTTIEGDMGASGEEGGGGVMAALMGLMGKKEE
jgi:hypothetical protein